MSKAELENALRLEILEVCRAALAEHFDLDPVKQIENVSVGEITLPLCDAEGNEKYPLLKVSIPRGTRDGNGGYEPYDGYAIADDYKMELEEKAAKKAASAAKKEAAAKAREAKREAKKVVKELNEKGLDKMIKGE
jgi:hypothetical protein